MSLVIDTSELISGALVIGNTGLGVTPSQIRSPNPFGAYGVSYLADDYTLPTDASKEFRGVIVTPPSVSNFFAYDDGIFTHGTTTPGTYSYTYRLYVDGVDNGLKTESITVSAASTTTTLNDAVTSGSFVGFSPSGALAAIAADDALLSSSSTGYVPYPIHTSLVIDTSELISGSLIVGATGLGVTPAFIPTTGENGGSYLGNDFVLPADQLKELRGLVITPPSAGTLFAYDNGSFELLGAPPGTYTFTYRLYVDGVDSGTATADATIYPPIEANALIVLDDVITNLPGYVQRVALDASTQDSTISMGATGYVAPAPAVKHTSLVVSGTELISSSQIIGSTGLGITPAYIPTSGENGGSYLANDFVLPADQNKELRGLVTALPSAGTLFAYDDGSFDFTGAPVGTYTFTYDLYVDGVNVGSSTVDATIYPPIEAAFSLVTSDVSLNLAGAIASTDVNVALDDSVVSGSASVSPITVASISVDLSVLSASAVVAATTVATLTTSDVSISASASVAGQTAVTVSTDDVVTNFVSFASPVSVLTISNDDSVVSSSASVTPITSLSVTTDTSDIVAFAGTSPGVNLSVILDEVSINVNAVTIPIASSSIVTDSVLVGLIGSVPSLSGFDIIADDSQISLSGLVVPRIDTALITDDSALAGSALVSAVMDLNILTTDSILTSSVSINPELSGNVIADESIFLGIGQSNPASSGSFNNTTDDVLTNISSTVQATGSVFVATEDSTFIGSGSQFVTASFDVTTESSLFSSSASPSVSIATLNVVADDTQSDFYAISTAIIASLGVTTADVTPNLVVVGLTTNGMGYFNIDALPVTSDLSAVGKLGDPNVTSTVLPIPLAVTVDGQLVILF